MKYIKERSEFLNHLEVPKSVEQRAIEYLLGKDITRYHDEANNYAYQLPGKSKWFTIDKGEVDAVIKIHGKTLMNESLNEGFTVNIKDIHFETDPKKQEEMKKAYGKGTGAMSASSQIEAANYALKKLRKEIHYDDKGEDVGVFRPGSYMSATSDWGDGPHRKTVKSKTWNKKEYDKWIKDMAGNGGANHAYDMAQNAKHEPGLIAWVQKNNPGVKPLDRIQWDIEAYS